MFDEEESKKLRIFQREKRQELQLIIERCNEVNFEYVCVPKVRSGTDLCFGSKTSRKIHLFADDKSVNSFMRRCFKENFPEPEVPKITEEEQPKEPEIEIEVKPTYTFASKVPRFFLDTIDSTGVYRRKKKTRESPVVIKKIFSAFGTANKKTYLLTRDEVENTNPGVGAYNLNKSKPNFYHHSFGGDIVLQPAYDIICSHVNFDSKCEACEDEPKNIYWKNNKTQTVLCRSCYNQQVADIKTKTRGIVEKHKKLEIMKNDFERKRYCGFYHEHNKTTAAIRLLAAKDFHKRIKQENFLNTLFKY